VAGIGGGGGAGGPVERAAAIWPRTSVEAEVLVDGVAPAVAVVDVYARSLKNTFWVTVAEILWAW
jgi:hypothetical protein